MNRFDRTNRRHPATAIDAMTEAPWAVEIGNARRVND